MELFKPFILPANFTFCAPTLHFSGTVANAMLQKKCFIGTQKLKLSLTNKKFKKLLFTRVRWFKN